MALLLLVTSNPGNTFPGYKIGHPLRGFLSEPGDEIEPVSWFRNSEWSSAYCLVDLMLPGRDVMTCEVI